MSETVRHPHDSQSRVFFMPQNRVTIIYAPGLSRGFFILGTGVGFGTGNRPEDPAKRSYTC